MRGEGRVRCDFRHHRQPRLRNVERPHDQPGRANASRLRTTSGRFSDKPSRATERRLRVHAPDVPPGPRGATRLSRRAENGAAPGHDREIDDLSDTRAGRSGACRRRPSTRQLRTSRAETVGNSAMKSTKYIITSAGVTSADRSRRRRLSRPGDCNAPRTVSRERTRATALMPGSSDRRMPPVGVAAVRDVAETHTRRNIPPVRHRHSLSIATYSNVPTEPVGVSPQLARTFLLSRTIQMQWSDFEPTVCLRIRAVHRRR